MTTGDSGRLPIVIIKQSAKTRPCFDDAVAPCYSLISTNDSATQSLVISLGMVMHHKFSDGLAKVLLSKRDDFVQALRLNG